jgi:uncharacterized protein YceK
MKKLLLIIAVVSLTGCSTIQQWIPVRWDTNQSQSITTIQQTTRSFNCAGDIAQQSKDLAQKVEWFEIYAKSKPTRDVIVPVGKMHDSVKELVDRTSKGPVSPTYCEIKKKILIQQADMLAHTVQGRF